MEAELEDFNEKKLFVGKDVQLVSLESLSLVTGRRQWLNVWDDGNGGFKIYGPGLELRIYHNGTIVLEAAGG